MKKRSKSKYGFLFFGILIGFLIGGSIVWWNQNRGNDWVLVKKIRSFFSVLTDSGSYPDKNLSMLNNSTARSKTGKARQYTAFSYQSNHSGAADSTDLSSVDQAALDEFIAAHGGNKPDSLVIDSFIRSQRNKSNSIEDVVVMKDQMLSSRSVEAKGKDNSLAVKNNKLDSLLTDETGQGKLMKSVFTVEFWKSPVNYKGYKKIRNKIVLFGVYQSDAVALRFMNKALYLSYQNNFYLIENTSDFKPLMPISNPQVLTQLKKS
jgi:hypothetical protein